MHLPGRRTFLTWLIGGSVAAVAAVVAAVVAVFVRPSPKPKQPVIHLPKALADIKDGEAVLIQAPSGAAFVMADGGGNNKAGDAASTAWVVRSCDAVAILASNCSHLGCAVRFMPTDKRFECPCHGSVYDLACRGGRSQFALDGSVVHGPARFPLAHIRWETGPAADEIRVEQLVLSTPRP